MVNWDWDANPTYESDCIRIDGALSPLVLYDMKLPRKVDDAEIGLMLSLADRHLQRGLPMVALVRHERGTGVISARHRKAFADFDPVKVARFTDKRIEKLLQDPAIVRNRLKVQSADGDRSEMAIMRSYLRP